MHVKVLEKIARLVTRFAYITTSVCMPTCFLDFFLCFAYKTVSDIAINWCISTSKKNVKSSFEVQTSKTPNKCLVFYTDWLLKAAKIIYSDVAL